MSTRETISVAEAASQLGVCVGTVYKLAHNGELEGYAVGRAIRIYADAIQLYRERHALKATPAAPPVKAARPAPKSRRPPATPRPVSYLYMG